jgi:catechol 2,3-dioxygenase-like lactoylglutathione lyase family enzyme
MTNSLNLRITATVLFVNNLDTCRVFYRDVLGFEETFTDDVSVAYRVDEQDFVLLRTSEAVNMISAEAVSPGQPGGPRVLLCAHAADIDATFDALRERGLPFIKPPKDQHWGRRTAYFADPEGNLWELWQPLAT